MADAETGLFEHVVVKDISRFARNTVDLLQNIRTLKQLGIDTEFLTANMTSMDNSEFVLTIFGALAQEESANTSYRPNKMAYIKTEIYFPSFIMLLVKKVEMRNYSFISIIEYSGISNLSSS